MILCVCVWGGEKDMKKNINITIDTDLNIEFEIEHC